MLNLKRSLRVCKFIFVSLFVLASSNTFATTVDLSGNPYNAAFTLYDQAGNAQKLYSFWFGYGPDSIVRDLDLDGGVSSLTLNGTVRVADVITNANGTRTYSYYDSGAGILNFTFAQSHDLGNGVTGGGNSGFGSFAYNGAQTLNMSISSTPMIIPGFSQANSFFYGENVFTGVINSANIFDFASWFTGSNVFINGASTSNYAKGDVYLSNNVPEPASMALLGLGVLGGALRRKSKAI